MDTWLYQGDHKRNRQGFVQAIDGGMEKIQQAMIRLSVPKGSFPLDLDLGSRLHELSRVPANQRQELALEYAREAILPVEGVHAVSAECKMGEAQHLTLEIMLEYSGEGMPESPVLFLWELNY